MRQLIAVPGVVVRGVDVAAGVGHRLAHTHTVVVVIIGHDRRVLRLPLQLPTCFPLERPAAVALQVANRVVGQRVLAARRQGVRT